MESTEIIEKIAHLEERNKSNVKRLDEHDDRIEKLEDTYSTLQNMNYRIGKVETTIEKIDTKLDGKINEDSQSKGKKWDKFVEYVFYFFLGAILGFVAFNLGFK